MNEEKFNTILQTKIPIAWIAGVRFESYNNQTFKTKVELDFLNQNPFGSMFWAVEGMAAEFAGGLMLLSKIESSGKSIASLVVKSEVLFTKKAVGKIIFTCHDGQKIEEAIQNAITHNTPKKFDLTSTGTDESKDIVAEFKFTWSIKVRS
ncbi:protein of unknown function [Tenacibaculum sp. MAR_2009_124]|uniref:DUF4442 domain-containing protein n=1 Tax=Tenacibaculum sp. MAR_2009_124 TaxID=1250059 RepID=UPI00089C3D03|nr:DUF4442 domain-containing protein [Tenacibaculum sp. MAR_2009_124]SEB45263.1 protein of unknown function [Tenacibaculum sp. MAR_2009_124]